MISVELPLSDCLSWLYVRAYGFNARLGALKFSPLLLLLVCVCV